MTTNKDDSSLINNSQETINRLSRIIEEQLTMIQKFMRIQSLLENDLDASLSCCDISSTFITLINNVTCDHQRKLFQGFTRFFINNPLIFKRLCVECVKFSNSLHSKSNNVPKYKTLVTGEGNKMDEKQKEEYLKSLTESFSKKNS